MNTSNTNITGVPDYDAPLASEVDQARRIAEMIREQQAEQVNITKLVTSAVTVIILAGGIALTYGMIKLIDLVMP